MSQQPEPATGLARVDDVDAPMARSVRDVESLTPRERLARLDSTAAHYVNTQRPANMLKAYAQDWKFGRTTPPISASRCCRAPSAR
jgi:hypothetical protein